MGCPIPQCGRFESFCVSRGAQSHNFGCANNKYIVCHAMVVCCCVSRGNAQPLDACTSHPKKNSLADRPIYHFHFNIHFLKALLALCWSQAPCHSVTSYAPTCAPHVIVYFRCLLESLLNFRSGACCFYANEAATGVFPLFACLPCPQGCLAVFLYTFLCPIATTTLALLSELPLSKLDSDDVKDVPPLPKLVVDELSVSDPSRSSNLRRSGRQSSSASLAGRCVPFVPSFITRGCGLSRAFLRFLVHMNGNPSYLFSFLRLCLPSRPGNLLLHNPITYFNCFGVQAGMHEP